MSSASDLPYFDEILERIARDDPRALELFGRHVHFGCWEDAPGADATPEAYERATNRLSERHFELAAIADGQAVLDAGCGFGGTLALLDGRHAGMRLRGLNIDPRQTLRASREVAAAARNEVAFTVGDACRLPFADASFDAVLAVECIFHFPSRLAFFREAHRVLRPGGRLVVSDILLDPGRAALLGVMAPLFIGSFRRTFGNQLRTTLHRDYRRTAAEADMVEGPFEDISARVLPTFRYYRRHFAGSDLPRYVGRAIWWMAALFRYRFLRYVLMSFQKR